jgi:hypothetical protein
VGPKRTTRALTHSVTQRASRCAHSRPRSSLSAGSTRTQQEVVGSLLTLATRSSSLTSSRARAQCTCRRRLAYRAFRKLMRFTFRWTGASVSVPRARARAVCGIVLVSPLPGAASCNRTEHRTEPHGQSESRIVTFCPAALEAHHRTVRLIVAITNDSGYDNRLARIPRVWRRGAEFAHAFAYRRRVDSTAADARAAPRRKGGKRRERTTERKRAKGKGRRAAGAADAAGAGKAIRLS